MTRRQLSVNLGGDSACTFIFFQLVQCSSGMSHWPISGRIFENPNKFNTCSTLHLYMYMYYTVQQIDITLLYNYQLHTIIRPINFLVCHQFVILDESNYVAKILQSLSRLHVHSIMSCSLSMSDSACSSRAMINCELIWWKKQAKSASSPSPLQRAVERTISESFLTLSFSTQYY